MSSFLFHIIQDPLMSHIVQQRGLVLVITQSRLTVIKWKCPDWDAMTICLRAEMYTRTYFMNEKLERIKILEEFISNKDCT